MMSTVDSLKVFIIKHYWHTLTRKDQSARILIFQVHRVIEGLKATHSTFVEHQCLPSASGHESAHAASDDSSANGAVAQAGSAVATHHQVTAGDEDDGHQFVHAHFTGPLLLQLPQQLLWAGVFHCGRKTNKRRNHLSLLQWRM